MTHKPSGEPTATAPEPWEYVPSDEHHGPYVTDAFGAYVCDCYVMSQPSELSARNGGPSHPIHMGECADANAALIASAPTLASEHREMRELLVLCEGHLAEMLPVKTWHPIGDCPVLNSVRALLARVRHE